MRGRGSFALGAAALVACAVSACQEAPTSILLELSTSVPCAETKGLVVKVVTDGAPGERVIETTRCEGTQGRQGEPRIGSLSIVPGGSRDAKITVRIVLGVERPARECGPDTAYAGCIVARRTLRFAPNRELDLPVVLRRECRGIACDDATTCVAGQCRAALIDDAAACSGATCGEGSLKPVATGSDAGVTPRLDAGAAIATDGGSLSCGASEKLCNGRCVSAGDPYFGCRPTGCTPCPDLDDGDYVCELGLCTVLRCKAGYKRCGDACVEADAQHGCGGTSCAPCDAANGTANCTASGACALSCKPGFKLCGGKCVNVNDPTYGCSPTQCSAASCPSPGAGTIACVGGACVVGACSPGTKNCNQKCVPTDAQNGCQDPARCAPCSAGNVCGGTTGATVCTCVPELAKTTCAGKACGSAKNNCGQTVNCPDRCSGYDTCGGGSAGPNGCGCTSVSACGGNSCGSVYDNCGRSEWCGSCAWPDFCGGGGGNLCGAPQEGNCGPNWATMGTFSCDAGQERQRICGCHPPLYSDPTSWVHEGGDCYSHVTGQSCP